MSNLYPWLSATLGELTQAKEHMPHALLLHGPRGIGKGALAAKLAEILLCASPTAVAGCGTCPACRWLAAGTHPDFRLLRVDIKVNDVEADTGSQKKPAKKKISIEAVRELLDALALTAHRTRRVIVIDAAEAMTRDAANALLKTLEEPAQDVLFLLISHRPSLLLATLRSRCRLIAIARPTGAEASAWLAQQQVDHPAERLARNGGAPLLALEEARNGQDQLRTEVLDALARVAQFGPIAMAERLAKNAAVDTLRWLQYWAHDLMAQKVAGVCRYNLDRTAQLASLAQQIGLNGLLRFQRGLTEAARFIDHPLNMQLYFEQQLIAYAELFNENNRDV